jgi:ethanolamine ammonia-lyase small subunit
VLIGERPGLSAADGVGAYITWAPRAGRRDSERNCVSNIRPPHGLSIAEGADSIVAIANAARAHQLTGVLLKNSEARALLPPPATDRGIV